MTVQLLAYKGAGNFVNAGIRHWGDSQYSHTELRIGGRCYSSSIRDGGVRWKDIIIKPEHWDVLDLPWADANAALAWFKTHEGEEYGVSDLLLCQFFGMRRDGRGAFCSEADAAMLCLPNPTRHSPQSLWDECVFMNEKYAEWTGRR